MIAKVKKGQVTVGVNKNALISWIADQFNKTYEYQEGRDPRIAPEMYSMKPAQNHFTNYNLVG